jgi:hypothetical protein
MWKRVEVELPPDLEIVTTTVWEYPGIMQVGIMRRSFLQPPLVWGQPIKGGLKNLRLAPALLDEFQHLLHASTIYAEVEVDKPRNQALLIYLGFEEISTDYERKLYRRSI